MADENVTDSLFGSNPLEDLFPSLAKKEEVISVEPDDVGSVETPSEATPDTLPSNSDDVMSLNRNMAQMMEMIQEMQRRLDQIVPTSAAEAPAENKQLALPAASAEQIAAQDAERAKELAQQQRDIERQRLLVKAQEAREQRMAAYDDLARQQRELEQAAEEEAAYSKALEQAMVKLEAGEDLTEEELALVDTVDNALADVDPIEENIEHASSIEETVDAGTAEESLVQDSLVAEDDLFADVSAEVDEDDLFADTSTPAAEDDLFADVSAEADDDDLFADTSTPAAEDDLFADVSAEVDEDDLFADVSAEADDDDLFADTSTPAAEDDLFADVSAEVDEDDLFADVSAGADEDDLFADVSAEVDEDDLFADVSAEVDEDDLFADVSAGADEDDLFADVSAGAAEDDLFADVSAEVDEDDLFADVSAEVDEDDLFADVSAGADEDDLFADVSAGAAEDDLFADVSAEVDEDDLFADVSAEVDEDDLFADVSAEVDEDDLFADVSAGADEDDLFAEEDDLFASGGNSDSILDDALSDLSAPVNRPEVTAPSADKSDDLFSGSAEEDIFTTPTVLPAPVPGPVSAGSVDNYDDLFGDSSPVADDDDDIFGPGAPGPSPMPQATSSGQSTQTPMVAAPVATASLLIRDPLWAIAQPARADNTQESRVLVNARDEAMAQVESEVGKSKGPTKVSSLPWDSIKEGNPLIISITSPKGGSGKSSTAMNLGAWAANNAQLWYQDKKNRSRGDNGFHLPRILVFDGDIGGGTLAFRVAGVEEPNVIDLVNDMDQGRVPQTIDDLNENYVIPHKEYPNLSILAAPSDPDAVEDLATEDYGALMNLLRTFYDVIIIDTGIEMYANFNQFWARAAHTMYILTLPEQVNLRKTAKFIDYVTNKRPKKEPGEFRPALVTRDRINLIIMRSDADWGISDIPRVVGEYFINMPKSHIFYFNDVDRAIIKMNNSGHFLALKPSLRDGKIYAKNIAEIAQDAFAKFAKAQR